MKIRYAITHLNKYGYRQLAFANQGRNHFDAREKAEEHLANMLKNNSISTLNSVYGDYRTLRVDPVECYDHGDAKKTIFITKKMSNNYTNSKGEPVEVVVDVFTRPNLRDGTHEMRLYAGRKFLENIFDQKKIDAQTTYVFIYYPETWANIPELQALMKFVFYFYPNIKKLNISTHSVYIIQNTHAENILLYDNNDKYKASLNPMDHMAPPPDDFTGLHVIKG